MALLNFMTRSSKGDLILPDQSGKRFINHHYRTNNFLMFLYNTELDENSVISVDYSISKYVVDLLGLVA